MGEDFEEFVDDYDNKEFDEDDEEFLKEFEEDDTF